MSLVQWVNVIVKLLTDGAFVTLVLGLVGMLLFRKPLRKVLEKLKKLGLFGESFQAEFDPVTALEREAAEVVTPQNGEAVEELIKSATLIGRALGEVGAPLPEWRFRWEGQEPKLTVTRESVLATLAALDESRRSSAMERAIRARLQDILAKQ